MIKKLLFIALFFASLLSYGQLTNEGQPASWSLKTNENISAIALPQMAVENIKNEDVVNDKISGKPYRIGISQEVNYGLSNAGSWTQLPNGDRIWRILFSSKDAVHLSANFNQFYLPKGGEIYLYNQDRSDLVGAYTEVENNENNMLGSWMVKGDALWIEYYEPKNVKGQGRLNISNIIHGYRLGKIYQKGYMNGQEKELNDSGDCNQDVDCPIGADFETERDLLKKSVAFLNMGDGFICTGALVNNTAEDNTPFFLTANHCYERSGGGTANAALFSMRFNWISTTPDCATTLDSPDGPRNFVMSGSTLRMRNAISDVMLVEIQGSIPDTWDVTYAGWDRSDTDPTFNVGIHHPAGDIMKICRDDDGATKVTQFGTDTWDINGLTNGGNSGNTTGWELGVTEGGSSGSPLFDQNGRIIGQLFGGLAACNGVVDNNMHDYYGRFASSWDIGTTNATQLEHWLDPMNTNPMTLNAKENVLAVNDEYLEENITVFPNPSRGFVQIRTAGVVGELKYEMYNRLGQIIKTNKLSNNEIVNFGNLPDDVYFMKITEIDSNKILVKKIVLSK